MGEAGKGPRLGHSAGSEISSYLSATFMASALALSLMIARMPFDSEGPGAKASHPLPLPKAHTHTLSPRPALIPPPPHPDPPPPPPPPPPPAPRLCQVSCAKECGKHSLTREDSEGHGLLEGHELLEATCTKTGGPISHNGCGELTIPTACSNCGGGHTPGVACAA